MREIKFRGKRLDNGEWVYGYYFIEERDIEDGIIWRDIPQIQQRYGDHFQYFDVDLATVGQYTGLHDKNGTEIYEGDIVCFDGYMTADDSLGFEPNGYIYDKDSVHCVLWDNVLGGWTLNFDEDEEWKYKRDTRGLLCDQKCEVIGNIHDNPELIEVRK